MRSGRFDAEYGVTIVEATFVIPLLFFLVLGMLDIGMWEFQTTQASNAARDGARVGILSYASAAGSSSSPGGQDFATVNDAVRKRLAGQTYGVTVSCVGPTSETTINCATANINPANPVDRIKVVVTWSQASFSPLSKFFGATQTVTGTAVMQLVGKPS